MKPGEFFTLIKNIYNDADIEYCINDVRQRIVNSWPDNIDDSLARSEWNWKPDLNLENTLNQYLQQ